MSSRVAIAAGGAAIGFLLTGGLGGITIGWTLGTLLGTVLFPTKTEGPRLEDLKVQISSYGAPLPRIWGWVRTAGNMIWSTDIVEVKKKKKVGIGQNQVTYKYYGNFSIAVCEGPATPYRIWENGKLIWERNVSTGAVTSKYVNQISFQTGTETQDPPTLHEQYDGVGNVPAYRGVALVHFDYYPLEEAGNRIGNYTFEMFGGDFPDVPIEIATSATQAEMDAYWVGSYGDPADPDYWEEERFVFNYAGIIDYVSGRRLIMRQNQRKFDTLTGGNDDAIHGASTTENEQWVNSWHWQEMENEGPPANVQPSEAYSPGFIFGMQANSLLPHLHLPSDPNSLYSMIWEFNYDESRITKFTRTNSTSPWLCSGPVNDGDHKDSGNFFRQVDSHFMCFDDSGNLVVYYDATDPNDYIQVRSPTVPFALQNTPAPGWTHPPAGFLGSFSQPPYSCRIPSNKLLRVNTFTSQAFNTTYGRDSHMVCWTIDLSTGTHAYVENSLWGEFGGPQTHGWVKASADVGTGSIDTQAYIHGVTYDPWNDKIIFLFRIPGEFNTYGTSFDRDYSEYSYATCDGDLTNFTYHGIFSWCGMRTADDQRAANTGEATFARTIMKWMVEQSRGTHTETFGAGVTQMRLACTNRIEEVTGGIIDFYQSGGKDHLHNDVLIVDAANGFSIFKELSDLNDDFGGTEIIELFTVTKVGADMFGSFANYTDWDTEAYFDPTSNVLSGYANDEKMANMITAGTTSGIDGLSYDFDQISPYYYLNMNGTAPPDCVDVADIVRDICVDSDMVEGTDFDVSQLTDCIPGYLVQRDISNREIMDPLRQIAFFDGIETAGQIVFKYRDDAPVLAIPEIELGTTRPGETRVPRVTDTRQQEPELPYKVTLKYSSKVFDYQVMTQYKIRSQATGRSRTTITLDAPATLTDDYAKNVAIKTLYQSWQMRTRYEINLPRKYIVLDPGDAITVNADGITYSMSIVEMAVGANGIIRIQAQSFDQFVYEDADSAATGGGAGIGGVVSTSNQPDLPVLSDTVLEFMTDYIPIDAYYDINFLGYAAEGADPSGSYPGGELYVSSTSGGGYEYADDLNFESIIGVIVGSFPAHTHQLIDRTNVLRVSIGRGQLINVSFTAMNNGANLAIVGDEFISFQTVTLVSEGIYDLSIIKRGMRSSDPAIPTGGHTDGTRFIFIGSGTDVTGTGVDDSFLNVNKYWKGVTDGQIETDITAFTTIKLTNAHRMPPKVAHLRASRDGSDNITFTWIARLVKTAPWPDPDDPEPDEVGDERYRIRVYNGMTVVRTQNVTNVRTWTYTAAQQTTDFGSVQDPVKIDVTMRRPGGRWGHVREETI